MGLCAEDVRLPITPPDKAAREQIEAALALAGVNA
jgi:4-hydroxy-tetrahydrodipicolinate synthase